jgi:hypothetical protein
MNRTIRILLVVLAATLGLAAHSQERKVTPVENEDNKAATPQLHYYDKHGNALKDPVLIWEEDTITKVKKELAYPLYNGVVVGANIFDAIMKVAGQSYSSFDLWGSVSLHNRFFPTLELGLGFANSTPAAKNFNYKTSASPYAKIGIDYNFLYNSNPDYMAFVGVRGGFSSFSYDVKDITITSDYWDQTANLDILHQKATALYGELLAGLRVKIYQRVSLGWSIRYHFKFHVSQGSNSEPWYIPGYGGRNTSITGTFSVIYTI